MKATAKKILLIFCGLLALVLLAWNGVVELRAEEPRRAIVAMEMVLSGEYWVPQINGWSYYNKPPVFNWILACFFYLTGSFNEWTVRLPSILSFAGTAVLILAVARRYLNAKTALLAALFTLTSADLLFYGTVNAGEIDLFFSLLVIAQIMSIFVFYQRKQYFLLFFLSYLFAALGTLTKGPPSVAFQALTLLPWLIWHREWKLLFSWQHILNGLLFLGLVGGYFWVYDRYDDGLGFAVRLFKEAAQRTGLETTIWDTLAGLISFPGLLIKLMIPWSLFLVFWWRKDFWRQLKSNPFLKFCAIFLLFNLPLYWISGDHRARYLYMFVPIFCVLLAYFYTLSTTSHPRLHRFFRGLFGILIGLGSLAFLIPPFLPQMETISWLWAKSLLLLSSGLLCFWAYQKWKSQGLLIFLIFILILRLGMNLFYLPVIESQQAHLSYRQHVDKILEITNRQPVRWTGKRPYVFTSDASIGPLQLSEVKLTTAPLLAYQIPYYLTKETGQIMQYDTLPLPGHYYLADRKTLATDSLPILYEFRERWQQMDLVLFQAAD